MSSSWPPTLDIEIAISREVELATLRQQLAQQRAAGELDVVTLRWAVEYVSELGFSVDDQLALFLDFAEVEWLAELTSPLVRASDIGDLAPRR